MATLDSLAGGSHGRRDNRLCSIQRDRCFSELFQGYEGPSPAREKPAPAKAGLTYPLDEILLLCLLAVLAGAEAVTDIALFGRKKLELLRRFRPFKDGTPAHDHLGDILAVLDAEQFQRCFVAWVAAQTGAPEGVIAIDGKTSRRSGRKKGGNPAIHTVSAFAARQRLVLGQVKVAEKSNEIIAIPKLLDMLAIEGAIVTIDAMGCQRDIAQKVVDKKADYVLALKGNQGSLREDVETFVAEQKAAGFKDTKVSQDQTVDSLPLRRRGAITDASKPEPQPSFTMSPGYRNGIAGPA
jgi:predicted transposase YbfD/YdcC